MKSVRHSGPGARASARLERKNFVSYIRITLFRSVYRSSRAYANVTGGCAKPAGGRSVETLGRTTVDNGRMVVVRRRVSCARDARAVRSLVRPTKTRCKTRSGRYIESSRRDSSAIDEKRSFQNAENKILCRSNGRALLDYRLYSILYAHCLKCIHFDTAQCAPISLRIPTKHLKIMDPAVIWC